MGQENERDQARSLLPVRLTAVSFPSRGGGTIPQLLLSSASAIVRPV